MSDTVLVVEVRRDGTWDYRYAQGMDDNDALVALRDIVGQMEAGAMIPNPEAFPGG